MGTERRQLGRCSFVVPGGFQVQEDASPVSDHPPESMADIEGAKPPVCVNLSAVPDPDREGDPEELDPAAFPASVSLTTLPAEYNPDPFEYLAKADEELSKCTDHYRVDFRNPGDIGGRQTAVGQSSFETNLRIYRLCVAWIADSDLVTVTMVISEPGVEEGWRALKDFAGSVRL